MVPPAEVAAVEESALRLCIYLQSSTGNILVIASKRYLWFLWVWKAICLLSHFDFSAEMLNTGQIWQDSALPRPLSLWQLSILCRAYRTGSIGFLQDPWPGGGSHVGKKANHFLLER